MVKLSEKHRKEVEENRKRLEEIEGSIEERNERIAKMEKDPEFIKLIESMDEPMDLLSFFRYAEQVRHSGGSVDYLGGPEQYIKDRDAFMKANGIDKLIY